MVPHAAAQLLGPDAGLLIDDTPRMRAEGRRIVLVSQQAPRLSELLEEAGVTATPSESLPDLPPPGSVTLVHGSLAEGWALDAEETVVLSDAEIFGLSKQRRYRRKRAGRTVSPSSPS